MELKVRIYNWPNVCCLVPVSILCSPCSMGLYHCNICGHTSTQNRAIYLLLLLVYKPPFSRNSKTAIVDYQKRICGSRTIHSANHYRLDKGTEQNAQRIFFYLSLCRLEQTKNRHKKFTTRIKILNHYLANNSLIIFIHLFAIYDTGRCL